MPDNVPEVVIDAEVLPAGDIACKVPLSALEMQICDSYSLGKTKLEISVSLGVPIPTITRLLKKPAVQTFVHDLIMASSMAMKSERIRIASRIAEDKMKEFITENEDGELVVDFARGSDKDLLNVIKTIDDMQKENEKKELGTGESVTYINILNQMMDSKK